MKFNLCQPATVAAQKQKKPLRQKKKRMLRRRKQDISGGYKISSSYSKSHSSQKCRKVKNHWDSVRSKALPSTFSCNINNSAITIFHAKQSNKNTT